MATPRSTAATTELYRELARLSEETSARLRDGDESVLEAAMERRRVLLEAIATTAPAPSAIPDVTAAIEQILSSDRELLAHAETLREALRRELAQLTERRTALQAYRGRGPASAVYVERLG
jgi:hypothetical protein